LPGARRWAIDYWLWHCNKQEVVPLTISFEGAYPMALPALTANKPLLAPLAEKSLSMHVLVVLVGSLLIAAASQIQVPFYPVPMTMQTFAVLLVGAVGGRRLGAETVGLFLAESAIGLPFLAGGVGGLSYFAGPTAGYLFGFLLAAFVVGWLIERGAARNIVTLVGSLLLGEVILFGLGALWLGYLFGASVAWTSGVLPFLAGDAVKVALVASTVLASQRLRKV
jgi:biotin transport system substrate-specific component